MVSIEQLQGRVLAYNDEASLSGLHCVSFFLKALSERHPNTCTLPFFSSAVRTGAHRLSVQAVVEGRADVLALVCCRTYVNYLIITLKT